MSDLSTLLDKIDTQSSIINEILNKLNSFEKTFISVNSDLIAQNIKMTESLHGKLKEPNLEINENIIKEKELYYYEYNGKIIVYGPGTYDNRPILKEYGDWNSINKSWDITIDLEVLLEKLPKIIKKEKQ